MGLNITRKAGQSVLIADGTVKVTVVAVKDSKAILCFECDRDIDVVREEVSQQRRDSKNGRVERVHETGECPLSTTHEERTD